MTTPQTAAPTTSAAAAPAAAAPAASAAPAEQTVVEQVADFDAAFTELTADAPQASPAPTPAPTSAPAAASPEADPAASPAPTPAPTSAPVANPEVAALQQQIAALQAQVTAAAPATPAATAAPVAEVPLYSADETEALKKYRTDWSEVAAGEALTRRAEYRELVGYIFGQIGPRIEALSASHQTVSSRTQYTAIKELVSDYDEVRDPTLAWIETQPEYLKRTYQDLAESGAPADIADMIARFKKETGWKAPAAAAPATPAVAPAPTAAPAASVAALPASAQAAIASLRPVATARTEQPQGVDMNDFDAAFKEFADAAR